MRVDNESGSRDPRGYAAHYARTEPHNPAMVATLRDTSVQIQRPGKAKLRLTQRGRLASQAGPQGSSSPLLLLEETKLPRESTTRPKSKQ